MMGGQHCLRALLIHKDTKHKGCKVACSRCLRALLIHKDTKTASR